MSEWIQTDKMQWVKKVRKYSFNVLSVRKVNGLYQINEEVIELLSYSEQELNRKVKAYYASLYDVKGIFLEEWPQVVAECIAELSSKIDFEAIDLQVVNDYITSRYGILKILENVA